MPNANVRLPQVGNFGFINNYFLPVWFGALAVSVAFLETRKQVKRVRIYCYSYGSQFMP